MEHVEGRLYATLCEMGYLKHGKRVSGYAKTMEDVQNFLPSPHLTGSLIIPLFQSTGAFIYPAARTHTHTHHVSDESDTN